VRVLFRVVYWTNERAINQNIRQQSRNCNDIPLYVHDGPKAFSNRICLFSRIVLAAIRSSEAIFVAFFVENFFYSDFIQPSPIPLHTHRHTPTYTRALYYVNNVRNVKKQKTIFFPNRNETPTLPPVLRIIIILLFLLARRYTYTHVRI